MSFFGFDAGTQQATITLTPVAPTSGGTALNQSTSWSTTQRTSGDQLDQNVIVTASSIATAFAGVTPKRQGYHARVSVDVSGAQGADSKQHTIWIAPCTNTAPSSVKGHGKGKDKGHGNGAHSSTTTTITGAGSTSTPVTSTPSTTTRNGISDSARLGSGTVRFSDRQRLGGSNDAFVATNIQVLVGQQIQYELLVTNATAASVLVSMSDARCDAGTLAPSGSTSLAAGATLTLFCSHFVGAMPQGHHYQNVATATASNAAGVRAGALMSAVNATVVTPRLGAKALTPAPTAKAQLGQATFTG